MSTDVTVMDAAGRPTRHCTMIAINRLANGHEPTRAYVAKRTGGTKADLDTLRRLKRYIAREVYQLLRDAVPDAPDVPDASDDIPGGG